VAQFDLFAEYQPRHNSDQLMALIDKMNAHQRGALWFAGQGIQKPWSMKREMLSPAYTTRLADLPVAK
jgi:DNA polymerase V